MIHPSQDSRPRSGSGLDHHNTALRPASPRRQSGIALVTTLIFLIVLIIIALAATRSATLEERMSGNTQDTYHAFEAAESSLQKALTAAAADPTTSSTNTYSYGTAIVSTSTVTTTFRQYTPLKPGTGGDIYDKTKFETGIFDQQASAAGPGGTTIKIDRGMAQVLNKAQ